MTESPASLDEEIESGDEDLPEDDVERLHGSAVVVNNDQTVLHTGTAEYHDLIQALSDDGYGVCIDLCGADYLGNDTRLLPVTVTAERFELVVNLLDVEASRRLRVRVQLPEAAPIVATITDIHPGAEAMEREANDMFGLEFEGHPDPTPILLPDDWQGHPLRKDYSMGRIPVQFKAVDGR
ncbi:MAG: NADH-quinone oxidoreductase subunit C [Candidatus Poriferisodalaceae bacterium]|nr:MAG: NADH-quinone oxidoreductase subunit C [Acidimicrobiales bacterium MED-G01]